MVYMRTYTSLTSMLTVANTLPLDSETLITMQTGSINIQTAVI